MLHIVDRAMRLWAEPVPDGDEGVAAFRAVYADPVLVNGEETSLAVLVDRARMLQRAFPDLEHEMHERIDTPGRSAFSFHLTGTHHGPLATPLGVVAPTGRRLRFAGLDIFTLVDDRVVGVWAIADYLGLLADAGAVALVQP